MIKKEAKGESSLARAPKGYFFNYFKRAEAKKGSALTKKCAFESRSALGKLGATSHA